MRVYDSVRQEDRGVQGVHPLPDPPADGGQVSGGSLMGPVTCVTDTERSGEDVAHGNGLL